MKITSFKELYINELRDLYSAETQLVEALPQVAESVHGPRLSEAVHKHLGQTMEHAKRLETMLAALGEKPEGVKCRAMEGLVREAHEAIHDIEAGPIRDLAIIGACKRVEHYETAGYSISATMAKMLGFEDHVSELNKTMGEEIATERNMTDIANTVIASAQLVAAK